ncbi:MAG: LysR family transcriptional regulator [Acidimicrobiia bacterium]|nr:LysR family transcriptional regulator [Acidimicrobiia bacterium]
MNLDHLQLFRDIAQARSISKAAQANGISQSAASQHLQELEKSLQVTLVDRSTRPLTLTEAGKLYAEYCRDVLRRRKEFDVALEKIKGRLEGTVRVASIYSVGLSEMSRLEEDFAIRCPGAELWVDYLRPEKVYQYVQSDRADLGLVSYPEPNKEIKAIAWREETMVVAVAPTHRLAGFEVLSPAQLEGESFIGFDEDLPISREVDRFLREAGVEVELVMHFDNIQMMKEAVALGSGISILPERILRSDISQGRLKAIPMEDPGLSRPLGILHLRRKKFNRATQAFLDLLMEEPAQPPQSWPASSSPTTSLR